MGRRPKVSDREPQNKGDTPWTTRYVVMVSETSPRLTCRSLNLCQRRQRS